MAYTKTNWVNNTTPLNATNMNKIEEGIAANDAALNTKASIDYVDKTHYGYSGDDLLIIPEGTTTIADEAYKNTNYKCVVIPDSVTTIGHYAFQNCSSLTNITIPDSVTSIGEYAFHNCDNLTSITIPNSVTSIGSAAFYYCDNLANITISNNITIINPVTFAGNNITNIIIPDGVTTIGFEAFYQCSKLTSITIPNSVTSIADEAFDGCPLRVIDLTAYTTQSFPTIDSLSIYSIASDCKIKVVKGRKNDLVATEGWSDYANYVVEVPTVETLDTTIEAVKNGYLPLSGGTLTGRVYINENFFAKKDVNIDGFLTCHKIVSKDGIECNGISVSGNASIGNSLSVSTFYGENISLNAIDSSEHLDINTNSISYENVDNPSSWTFSGISDSIGDSSTIAVSQKCLKEALINSKLPISAGTGTNSVVGNDLSTNTAISENAVSFGTNNKGGLKGYYWSAINLSAKTITLATAHTGGTAVNCEYAVGDTISIVNDSKFDECSKITAINGSIITVDSLPFNSVSTASGDWTDYCIYCPEKANIGLADLGRDSFIAGNGNKGGNWCSVVAGRDNNVIGQYGVAMGRLNKVGYAAFSVGRNNNVLGQYASNVGGSENIASGSWAVSGGRKNNVSGRHGAGFGYGNTISGESAFASGTSNIISGKESFVSGVSNTVKAERCIVSGKGNEVTGNYSSSCGENNNIQSAHSFASGYDNDIYGTSSLAAGKLNISGIRGYYFTANGNTLTLYSDVNHTSPATCEYYSGDILSAGIGARYNHNITITGVSGNTITTSPVVNLSDYGVGDRFIYCESRPHVGAAQFGESVISLGLGNKAFGKFSFLAGRSNTAPSAYGNAFGYNNRIGYCGLAAGYNNSTDKEFVVMLGSDNQATANLSYLIGKGLKSTRSHQFIIGQFNKETNSLFVIGYGSSNDRKNIMECDVEGNLTIIGKLTVGGSTITGISNLKGTSPTIAVSQKCLSDNYIARTRASVCSSFNLLSSDTGVPKDNEYYISQDASMGSILDPTLGATSVYCRRPMSTLWTYINGKLKDTYLPLSGGTLTGALEVAGSISVQGNLSVSISDGAGVSVSDEHSAVLLSNTGLEDPTGTWRFAGSIFSTEDLIAGQSALATDRLYFVYE